VQEAEVVEEAIRVDLANAIRIEGEGISRLPGMFRIVHNEKGSKEPL